MSDKGAKVLGVLLRPAAIFAIRSGLKINEILEVLKSTLVTVASEELSREDARVSKSRVAVMTGLQRREVSKHFDNVDTHGRSQNVLARVIGLWCQDNRFSKNGLPRPLSAEGIKSEFAELVRSVSLDLDPYAALFELERIKALKRENDRVELLSNTLELKDDIGEGYSLWSHDAEDLTMIVEENLLRREEIPNLHITTRYDNVVRAAVPEIRSWFIKRGAEFQAEVRAFLSKFDKDLNPTLYEKEGGTEVVFSTFSRVKESSK